MSAGCSEMGEMRGLGRRGRVLRRRGLEGRRVTRVQHAATNEAAWELEVCAPARRSGTPPRSRSGRPQCEHIANVCNAANMSTCHRRDATASCDVPGHQQPQLAMQLVSTRASRDSRPDLCLPRIARSAMSVLGSLRDAYTYKHASSGPQLCTRGARCGERNS